MSNTPLLYTENLCKHYKDGQLSIEVFRDLNFSIRRNESVAIIGASGSGKSTLLHLLGGLDKPTSGKIILDGKNIHTLGQNALSTFRNQKLGFVYQFHHLLPEFSTLENVMMPLLIGKTPKSTAMQKARLMLNKVGLGERAEHRPAELSGGERQRAAIARALVAEPACILADEPTGNLDRKNAQKVLELMLQLKEEHQTSLIVVTHDEVLAEKFDRQMIMSESGLTPVTRQNSSMQK